MWIPRRNPDILIPAWPSKPDFRYLVPILGSTAAVQTISTLFDDRLQADVPNQRTAAALQSSHPYDT
ncbi:hypothetical protein D3C76_1448060 [compost metagenome]